MNTASRAVETTGLIDGDHRLIVAEALPIDGPRPVRVILLLSDEPNAEEPGEREWLRAASSSPAFEFLKDEQENIYSPTDGRPFRDEG
jgi:hypothetical protein